MFLVGQFGKYTDNEPLHPRWRQIFSEDVQDSFYCETPLWPEYQRISDSVTSQEEGPGFDGTKTEDVSSTQGGLETCKDITDCTDTAKTAVNKLKRWSCDIKHAHKLHIQMDVKCKKHHKLPAQLQCHLAAPRQNSASLRKEVVPKIFSPLELRWRMSLTRRGVEIRWTWSPVNQ